MFELLVVYLQYVHVLVVSRQCKMHVRDVHGGRKCARSAREVSKMRECEKIKVIMTK